jgi:hypothetical protein
VDLILEELGKFWGNTDVVLEALTKKGQHAEQFISFGHNPKLLLRFKERLHEYKTFWEGVLTMSSSYLNGIVEPQQMLDNFVSNDSSSTSSSSSRRGGYNSMGSMRGNKSSNNLDSLC